MEETIPAMVTIKRIIEKGNSPPTVTITLKGATPDQDKLLYTLVNSHSSNGILAEPDESTAVIKKKNKCKIEKNKVYNVDGDINKKKKTTALASECIVNNSITTREMKVTLTIDKSFYKEREATMQEKNTNKQDNKENLILMENKSANNKNNDKIKVQSLMEDSDIDIPSLKLPPGKDIIDFIKYFFNDIFE